MVRTLNLLEDCGRVEGLLNKATEADSELSEYQVLIKDSAKLQGISKDAFPS